MVDLAKQAFNTNNFHLAVEIYEREINEHGPSVDLFLGLADSFAKTGQFGKAFESYSRASRLGSISHEKLKHLVSSLINCVKTEKSSEQMLKSGNPCLFTCLLCRGLLNDPVTIPCGHTFCRKCLEKDQTKTCKNCGIVHYCLNISRIKTNYLLSRVVEQWFPSECRAACLKSKGNIYMERQKYEKAIASYSEAIELVPSDHLSLSNRSHAYAQLERFKEALEDAEKVISIRPDWPKAYFRKGFALFCQDRYEDAIVALLQCLALDSSISSAKNYLSKALHKIITPLPPDDPKAAALQQQVNPTVLQQLIMTNFQATPFQPRVSIEDVMHLKDIISDTVATATNFEESADMDQKPDPCRIDEVLSYRNSQHEAMDQSGERTKSASVPNSRTASPSPSQEPLVRDDLGLSLKRSRIPSDSSPTSSTKEPPFKIFEMQKAGQSDKEREVPRDLLNRDDFDCSLCYRLLYEPVTTPCGHAFCRRCLDRCLDHQSSCPLCKGSLAEYLAERRQTATESIVGIIKAYFPSDFEERKRIHEEEIAEFARMTIEGSAEIPVFVCTQGFPYIPCPLHIFEPRYRLMIRQCMESGMRQFGMTVSLTDDEEQFAEFGTMLEIRDVQFFPDGRSLVDTIGGRRFKVLSRGKRDGYCTAKVEFIFDKMPPPEEIEGVKAVQNNVYTFAKNWFDSLPGLQREQIHKHYGQFPALDEDFTQYPNGPGWLWWLISILPSNPQIQLSLLATVVLKERLEGVKRIIQYLSRRRTH